MKSLTPKDLIKILMQAGFKFQRIKGSHHVFRHSDGRITIVRIHSKDLPKGTLYAILKQAGISKDDI